MASIVRASVKYGYFSSFQSPKLCKKLTSERVPSELNPNLGPTLKPINYTIVIYDVRRVSRVQLDPHDAEREATVSRTAVRLISVVCSSRVSSFHNHKFAGRSPEWLEANLYTNKKTFFFSFLVLNWNEKYLLCTTLIFDDKSRLFILHYGYFWWYIEFIYLSLRLLIYIRIRRRFFFFLVLNGNEKYLLCMTLIFDDKYIFYYKSRLFIYHYSYFLW